MGKLWGILGEALWKQVHFGGSYYTNDRVFLGGQGEDFETTKTFYNINDYAKLRVLFGELLREIQRITSEGDYQAGKALVENYGVKVNQDIHKEVLKRVAPLNLAPYNGFVNPVFIIEKNENNEVVDVKISNEQTFEGQMLYYAEKYHFLD